MFLVAIAVAAPNGAATVAAEGIQAIRRLDEGTLATEFELEGLDGRAHRLSEFKGSVVLLHFFASWCEPCKKEFPSIKSLGERFAGRGLEIVAVSEDNLEATSRFIEKQGARATVLFDRYGGVLRRYKTGVIPSTVIIGRDGAIKGVVTGPLDWGDEGITGYLEDLIRDK